MGLLAESLRFAVPMWKLEMADWPRGSIEKTAWGLGSIVCAQADTLMFKGETRAHRQNTRDTFNAMAKGLACLCLLVPDFDLEGHLDKLGDHEDEFRKSPHGF